MSVKSCTDLGVVNFLKFVVRRYWKKKQALTVYALVIGEASRLTPFNPSLLADRATWNVEHNPRLHGACAIFKKSSGLKNGKGGI